MGRAPLLRRFGFLLAGLAIPVVVAACDGDGSDGTPQDAPRSRDAALLAAVRVTPFVPDDILQIGFQSASYSETLRTLELEGFTDLEPFEQEPGDGDGVSLVSLIGYGTLNQGEPVPTPPTCVQWYALVHEEAGRAFLNAVRDASCPGRSDVGDRDRALLGVARGYVAPPVYQDVQVTPKRYGTALQTMEDRGFDVPPRRPGLADDTPAWLVTFKAPGADVSTSESTLPEATVPPELFADCLEIAVVVHGEFNTVIASSSQPSTGCR